MYNNYIFNIPNKCTHTVNIYYLSHISYMFRRILHRPQGELLSPAHKHLLIVILLH